MRIVGGRLRERAVKGPASDSIRPTSDRLRESLFNVLAHAYYAPAEGGARVFCSSPARARWRLRRCREGGRDGAAGRSGRRAGGDHPRQYGGAGARRRPPGCCAATPRKLGVAPRRRALWPRLSRSALWQGIGAARAKSPARGRLAGARCAGCDRGGGRGECRAAGGL